MSTNQGIHIDLTAETSVFTNKMRAAQQTLASLKNEVSMLKTQEASLENSISKLTDKLQKKQNTLETSKAKLKAYEDAGKGASASAEKLRQQIEKQESSIKEVSDKINKNNRDLKENASAQDICANKIRLATVEVDKLTNEYSQNTTELQKNETANKNFTNTIKTGLLALKGVALGYAGKTLYNALIGTNAEYEQYLTSFDVLLQSSEKAEKMMEDLDKFGAETPFELSNLTSATEQLLAFGTAEEDVLTRLQQLGDLSKGKADILERITLAYGKMQAKGKVTLEELNMLTEAGVPILKELADQIGITTDELFKKISAGEINIENINKAIESMTSEGGQFFGMMAEQAQTMDGMMSTMSDNINIALRQLGEGAFDAVKDEISNLLAEIQRMNEDGSLKKFAEDTGEGIANIVEIIAGTAKTIYNLKEVLLVGASAWASYKLAMVAMGTLTSLKKGFDVCKTAVEMYRAAQLKSVSASELLHARSLKEIAVKTGLITATKAQTTATEGATAAQTALNASMSANPIGLVIAATGMLVSVISIFISKSNQAKEASRQKAIEAGKAAEEEKQSVKELIDEYEKLRTAGDWDDTARERAKEIQEEIKRLVGGEVEGLDLVNGRLGEQIKLLDEAALKQAKSNAADLLDAEQAAGEVLWDKIYKNKKVKIDFDNDEVGEIVENALDLSKETDKNALRINGDILFSDFHDFLDKYPKIIKARDALYEAGQRDSEVYKSLSEAIALYSEEYNSYMENLSAWQENEATVHLGEYMKENDIDSQDAFDNYLKDLDKLEKSGEISKQYKQVLIDIANKAFPQFARAAEDATDTQTKSAKSASEMIDSLNEVGDSLSVLNDAQSELNSNGKISTSTLSDIKEKFSGLGDGLDDYIERLVEANGNSAETEKIMSEMTVAMLETSFSTEDLANADAKLIATMLEEQGVANATELATELVNKAKARTKLSTENLTNATTEEIESLYNDIKAMGLSEDQARALIAEKLALEYQTALTEGKTAEFIDKLDGEADALGITKQELSKLIQSNIDFNNTKLDTSQKIDALHELALAYLDVADATSFAQNVANTAGQIYNEWLTEHPEDYAGAKAAANEHVDYYINEMRKKLKKQPSTMIDYTGKSKNPSSNETQAYKDWQNSTKEREDAFKDRFSNSMEWIENQIKNDEFEAVYAGFDRISTYTEEFYASEKQKLNDALDKGIVSQEQYLKISTDLSKNYADTIEEISKKKQDAIDSEFSSYIAKAEKYISDRNFYGDWGQFGDTEEQALARMYSVIDKFREKGVSDDLWIDAVDELSKEIYKVSKDNLLDAIDEQEKILRNAYKQQLEMKKEAAEKEIEIAQKKADAEIEAINASADAEIKRIDELIEKRKAAREDEDYNLKLQRLQLKLEYEHDEDNKTALQKEITKLKKEIADTEFEREMERQKEAVEDARNTAVAAVEARLKNETDVAKRKITIAENKYEEQTSDGAIANELATIFNYRGYEEIFKSLGVDFADGITRGLQGILSAFNERFNISGKSGNYDYSTNSKTYNMYASVSGAQTSEDIIRNLRKFFDKLELEGSI